MSEHISITGKVNHWHSPQEIFAYCFRCKKELGVLTIEVNQSFSGVSITGRCPKCKRAIWTGRIDTWADNEEWTYWHKEKDKKCKVCEKPTNEKDAVCFGGKASKKKMDYWCSEKCYKKSEMRKNGKRR